VLDESEEDLIEEACGRPCPYESVCEHCVEYWDRMVKIGFWDPQRMQWSQQALRQCY
jgi:predicted TIM-barrel fold metal-dependent hydrolase